MCLKICAFNMLLLKKYFFYCFSIYLALRGLIMVIWSTKVYVNDFRNAIGYLDEWKKNISFTLETLIILSGVLVIFAFCSGTISILFFDNAKFRKRCTRRLIFWVTLMFTFLFITILIIQTVIAINILVMVSRADIDFKEAFSNYVSRWDHKKFIDEIQDKWYCCGIYSYHDYRTILNIAIPGSCCYKFDSCTEIDVFWYRPGCAYRIENFILLQQIFSISVYVLTVTVIESVGLLFALYLIISVRKKPVKANQRIIPGNSNNKVYAVYT